MSDQAPNQAEQPKRLPKPGKRGSGIFVWLALLLAFAANLGCAYLAYYVWQLERYQAQTVAELKQTWRTLENHPSLQELKNHFVTQNAAFSQQLQTLDDNVIKLNASLTQTTDWINRGQRDWVLAEVEYLIHIAISRSELIHDTHTAINALQAADQRLASLADARLLPVRKQLAEDIGALKALESPDVDGVVLKLLSITRRLPQLPLARVSEADYKDTFADELPSSTAWSSQIWQRLKDFIGLHPPARPSPNALARENLYYLDQLLRLEIEAARQAILRLDHEDFNRRLARMQNLLNEHYQNDHPQVIALQQDIAALQQMPIFVELPELGASLIRLRAFMDQPAARQP